MIKAFIREHTPHSHWHIDERPTPPDTYKSMTLHIPMDTRTFFDQLQPAEIKANSLPSSYAHQCASTGRKATQIHDNYLKRTPWCDLKAFSMLIPALPAGSRLQLGNSTPIRYAQLFRYTQIDRTDANRGTSGIDGCTSTAMGAASTFDGITTLIVGATVSFTTPMLYGSKTVPRHYESSLSKTGEEAYSAFWQVLPVWKKLKNSLKPLTTWI